MVTTVLFVFPPELPVTPSNMNYCVVVFGIILIISTVQWIVDGRKNYKGPRIDAAALQNGEVIGMAAADEAEEKVGKHNTGKF